MSEALSKIDPHMLQLGVILSELVGELHTSAHNRFYAEFKRLEEQGLSAPSIAEGLLLFIHYDDDHPAYKKLKNVLHFDKNFGEEIDTDIRTRQTQPIDDEILRLREKNAVDELLADFVEDRDRETLTDVHERDARHTAQTLTNEAGSGPLSDDDPFERETLIPKDFPSEK